MASLDQLNQRFSSANRFVTFEKGNGGLTRAVLRSPKAEAHVYLHGAHVTHFGKAGEPAVLFMSGKSSFEAGKPIRGGVPICFPWFGPRAGQADAPAHGFARLNEWEVESAESAGEQTSLTLVLRDTPESQKLWPHKFAAHFTVTLTDQLALELAVTNTGTAPLTFEEALHTYFAVTDIKSTTVEGLGGTDYIDKTDAMAVKTQGGKPIRIVEETDRVYLNTQAACTVNDPGNKRKIVIAKENSDTTVLWNPWIAKAKAMPDFGDEEWPRMVCVETCNVNVSAVALNAGATHTMRAVIGTQRA